MSHDNCDVCSSVMRRFVDLELARGRPTKYITRRTHLGRKQIVKHRDQCLEGNPLRAVAAEMGYTLVQDSEATQDTPQGSEATQAREVFSSG